MSYYFKFGEYVWVQFLYAKCFLVPFYVHLVLFLILVLVTFVIPCWIFIFWCSLFQSLLFLMLQLACLFSSFSLSTHRAIPMALSFVVFCFVGWHTPELPTKKLEKKENLSNKQLARKENPLDKQLLPAKEILLKRANLHNLLLHWSWFWQPSWRVAATTSTSATIASLATIASSHGTTQGEEILASKCRSMLSGVAP